MRNQKLALQLFSSRTLYILLLITICTLTFSGCDLLFNAYNYKELQLLGQVVNSNGDGVPGITISFIGGDGTVVSDTLGNWNSTQSSFPIMVLPQKEYCSFNPDYVVVDKDFEGTIQFQQLNNLSGKVTNSEGKGLVNVEIRFSDGTESVYTGVDGRWTADGLSDDVEITPKLCGYLFYPETIGSDSTLPILFQSMNKVGYRGPSGGYIFYDDESDGIDDIPDKRFLEAAPAGWYNGGLDPSFIWGADGFFLDNSQSVVGSGYQNTKDVIQSIDILSPGVTDYACKICDDSVISGFTDWFLPSKDELSLMYSELAKKGFGGFTTTAFTYYLSSTEYSNDTIVAGDFCEGGVSGGYPKDRENHIRPVRAF